MNDPTSAYVIITAKDMYDQIVILSGKVDAMSAIVKQADEDDADHEVRIRSLERWRYSIPSSLILGAASLLTALLTHR